MISKFDIQKLQDLPIEQVAGALGLNVSHHKALCPFHNDSNPSLTFHRGKNRYRCFVCDAHGGVIDLVMRYEHKSFLEACKWLADANNLVVSSDTNLNPQRSIFIFIGNEVFYKDKKPGIYFYIPGRFSLNRGTTRLLYPDNYT